MGKVFNGDCLTIDGNNHIINGDNCKIKGNHNILNGDGGYIYGDYNTINGDGNTIIGKFNKNNGDGNSEKDTRLSKSLKVKKSRINKTIPKPPFMANIHTGVIIGGFGLNNTVNIIDDDDDDENIAVNTFGANMIVNTFGDDKITINNQSNCNRGSTVIISKEIITFTFEKRTYIFPRGQSVYQSPDGILNWGNEIKIKDHQIHWNGEQIDYKFEKDEIIDSKFILELIDSYKDEKKSNKKKKEDILEGKDEKLKEDYENNTNCIICEENVRTLTIDECGHFCCCFACARKIKESTNLCPICNQKIVKFRRVFV